MGIIERILCKICDSRKPRRYCPGVLGDICSICCGTEREVTVRCPLECPHLQESRRHEQPPIADEAAFPNRDIRVTEAFLRENEPILVFGAATLLQAAMETEGAVDSDVREALDSLVRTYRTLESGLYYESRPTNPIAANIMTRMQDEVRKFREEMARNTGMHQVRDADFLGIFAFLQRLGIQHNNGRRLGRAFLDFLRTYFQPAGEQADDQPSLIVP